jgi:hypothetical protein
VKAVQDFSIFSSGGHFVHKSSNDVFWNNSFQNSKKNVVNYQQQL